MKKIVLLMSLIAAGIVAHGQSMDELKRIYQDSYGRALKYNDRFEAKSVLYRLIAMEPQNDSLIINLAYLYIEAGQYASSVLACMDALEINPQNRGALEMSAMAYENLGLKDKSLENYEKLFLLTNDFNTLYKMAFLQYDLGQYQQSDTNADILIEKPEAAETTIFITIDDEQKEYPVKAALYNLKGLVDKELGDLASARANYEEALKVAPDFELAKLNLSELQEN